MRKWGDIVKIFYFGKPASVDGSCCAGVTPESPTNAFAAMYLCPMDPPVKYASC